MRAANIVLIGFMGVGKGSLARELAARTHYFSIDTDDLIESFENRKIRKIFKDDGEPFFRGLERKTADWLEKHVENTIISTGGGFYAVDNLNRIGTVVFLKAEFDSILKKITDHPKCAKKIKKRPLFQEPQKAKKLFETREPLYQAKADITIEVNGKSTAEIAAEILAEIKQLS